MSANEIQTLADLVEESPVKTHEAEVDFTVSPTKLRVGETTFKMGICTADERLSRGKREYKFQTGPYQIRVVRNDQAIDGALYRIEVETN